MSRHRVLALLAPAACLLALAGCAPSAAQWDAEAAQYAVYATRIPLYPGSEIVDAMGSESWGDTPDSYSYGMTWWCEVKATREELLAWYKEKLPNATQDTPYGDGSIELTVIPEGAAPNEDMGVLLEEDGKYRVFEHTKQKKRA